jgi:molybdenum cofactor guanylyltransferase
VTAGLLLTGGSSLRMGFDKAELVVEGERLADRTARVLTAVCDPALEVGPGRSRLPFIREGAPGSGPLAALVAGSQALRARGYEDALLLLAVDLPFVTERLLSLLARRAGKAAAVPVAGGEPQPCCACYGPAARDAAEALVAGGERSLRALLAATTVERVEEPEWRAVAPAHALDDLDTPADVARHGLERPDSLGS